MKRYTSFRTLLIINALQITFWLSLFSARRTSWRRTWSDQHFFRFPRQRCRQNSLQHSSRFINPCHQQEYWKRYSCRAVMDTSRRLWPKESADLWSFEFHCWYLGDIQRRSNYYSAPIRSYTWSENIGKNPRDPAEKLVETSESIKEVLSTISADIPEDLQKVLAPISSLGLFRARVETSVARIKACQSQLPLRKTIANKCQ